MKLIELLFLKIYFDGFGLITIGIVFLILFVYWIDLTFQEIKKRRSERKKRRK